MLSGGSVHGFQWGQSFSTLIAERLLQHLYYRTVFCIVNNKHLANICSYFAPSGYKEGEASNGGNNARASSGCVGCIRRGFGLCAAAGGGVGGAAQPSAASALARVVRCVHGMG